MKTERATVLVVDDEPELREIFALWLNREGYTILTAAHGAEALNLLTTHPVDALISDIRRPVMDGVALVRRIFEMKRVLPSIIFVSGFGDVSAREMYALGVEAMIAKPLVRKDLLHALASSLKQREQLWLTPAEGPVTESLECRFASVAKAGSPCEFRIGRGGICLRSSRAFVEDALVDLAIDFAEEGLTIRGQGVVRWCSLKDQRIGVEFVYLDPACREWVIPHMQGNAPMPFIPGCGAIPGCSAT
jgi:CheY-like chemotaxis protein